MSDSDELGFVLLAFFGAIVYSLWRLVQKVLGRGLEGEEEEKKEEKKGGRKRGKLPEKVFFVKSQTRRRRLDITRKGDNILSGGVGKKLKRHRRGMFGK